MTSWALRGLSDGLRPCHPREHLGDCESYPEPRSASRTADRLLAGHLKVPRPPCGSRHTIPGQTPSCLPPTAERTFCLSAQGEPTHVAFALCRDFRPSFPASRPSWPARLALSGGLGVPQRSRRRTGHSRHGQPIPAAASPPPTPPPQPAIRRPARLGVWESRSFPRASCLPACPPDGSAWCAPEGAPARAALPVTTPYICAANDPKARIDSSPVRGNGQRDKCFRADSCTRRSRRPTFAAAPGVLPSPPAIRRPARRALGPRRSVDQRQPGALPTSAPPTCPMAKCGPHAAIRRPARFPIWALPPGVPLRPSPHPEHGELCRLAKCGCCLDPTCDGCLRSPGTIATTHLGCGLAWAIRGHACRQQGCLAGHGACVVGDRGWP